MRMAYAAVLTAMIVAWSVGAAPQGYDALGGSWAPDWNAKNLDAIVALYAPEPVFLPTSGVRWAGATVIRKAFAGALKQFAPEHP